ncbi:hypothetical protein [Tateyamaria sp.]|uniref:hypothetical protein n=1 Tax=Tateyamaria sp. TaxID=1929288 RepID=UPI0032A0D5D4
MSTGDVFGGCLDVVGVLPGEVIETRCQPIKCVDVGTVGSSAKARVLVLHAADNGRQGVIGLGRAVAAPERLRKALVVLGLVRADISLKGTSSRLRLTGEPHPIAAQVFASFGIAGAERFFFIFEDFRGCLAHVRKFLFESCDGAFDGHGGPLYGCTPQRAGLGRLFTIFKLKASPKYLIYMGLQSRFALGRPYIGIN